MPNLSVIVPAYNSVKFIERCLTAIRSSSYKQYELIVVDDASQDGTLLVAEKYADKVIALPDNCGRNFARRKGIEAANTKIIVDIDSDVIIQPDALGKIAVYFDAHPEIDAVTGLLSNEHPNGDFFSQYKNLYMHYIFSKLPQSVTFLYGSICAMRRDVAVLCDNNYRLGEDTAYGQFLVSRGKKIVFLRDLETVHLKKYNFLTFIKNDFFIPFYWAGIFATFKGWKQLGKNKVGFAHSPIEQLVSVCLAPVMLLFLPLSLVMNFPVKLFILCVVLLWLGLNISFLRVLLNEKGVAFAIAATFVTFLDNIVMAFGIMCGFLSGLIRVKNRGR